MDGTNNTTNFDPETGMPLNPAATNTDPNPQAAANAPYVNGNAGFTQPGYTQPGYAQPEYTQPGYAQPGYTQPGYAQPEYTQPGYLQPGTPAQGYATSDEYSTPSPDFYQSSYYNNTQPAYATAGFYDPDAANRAKAVSGKSTPSLVCGIISVSISWLGFLFMFIFSWVLGILSVTFGSISLAKDKGVGRGKAITGIVTGALGIILSLLFTIIMANSL